MLQHHKIPQNNVSSPVIHSCQKSVTFEHWIPTMKSWGTYLDKVQLVLIEFPPAFDMISFSCDRRMSTFADLNHTLVFRVLVSSRIYRHIEVNHQVQFHRFLRSHIEYPGIPLCAYWTHLVYDHWIPEDLQC